jgi:phosphatidylglycerophosphate synthase
MGNELGFKISKEIYPPEKEKANKQTVWEYYFARKIAFLIAPVFLKLGTSANQVSFLSMAAGIVGAVLIALGNFWMILLGGLLMQIWLILDKTDGVVARLGKTTTKFGEFFEEFNGSLLAALFFTSIGFAASGFSGFLIFYIPPKIFIILGLATSLFVIFRHLIFCHFAIVFSGTKKGDGVFSGSGKISAIYNFSIKFTGVYSLAQPIFLLALIFNFLGLYTLVYFFIQGALMLASSVYLLAKAGSKK